MMKMQKNFRRFLSIVISLIETKVVSFFNDVGALHLRHLGRGIYIQRPLQLKIFGFPPF